MAQVCGIIAEPFRQSSPLPGAPPGLLQGKDPRGLTPLGSIGSEWLIRYPSTVRPFSRDKEVNPRNGPGLHGLYLPWLRTKRHFKRVKFNRDLFCTAEADYKALILSFSS